MVHIGAFHGSRQWPADRFAAVVQHLLRAEEKVVLTGGQADLNRAKQVANIAGLDHEKVLAGKIDLKEFAGLIATAKLVITADTGASHLATAYATKSVTIFGPAPPSTWGPIKNKKHRVLTKPELRIGDVFATTPDPALLGVQIDEVIDAIDYLIKDR